MNRQKELKQPGQVKFLDIQRVWRLIPQNKKKQGIIIFLMMIVGMVLEMIGVGLVLPVITVVSNPDLIKTHALFSNYYIQLGQPSKIELVLGAMALLVLIYGTKNLYLALLAWKQSKFIYSTQAEMAKGLFSGYLQLPYTFHLQRNSSDLINNLQVELNLFMNYMLSPGMMLIAETLVVLGLVGLLLYFEPIGTIAVFMLFLIVGGVFQKLIRRRIVAWGKSRQYHEALRMKNAQQGIGAIKDVKVSATEDFFIREYQKNSEKSLSMNQKNSFTQNTTRLWLEVLAMSGLLVLSVGMYLQQHTAAEIMPVIALFAVVSFRLMPSFSRIVSTINLLRFGTSVASLIENEFEHIKQVKQAESDVDVSFMSDIEFAGVSYNYPGSKKSALKQIELSIKKGEMVGFVGPSGSGKSTLIDVLMGLLMPSQGAMKVDGKTIDSSSMKDWQNKIGYVPQTIYLTDDTVRRNIAFGIEDELIDEKAIWRAIKAAQVEPFIGDLPDGIDTILGERGVRISGGQRQRIGIARALYHNPEILVLDEATSALDSQTEEYFMQAIVAMHGTKTILTVAHRISTLKNCDKVYRLDNGTCEIANDQLIS